MTQEMKATSIENIFAGGGEMGMLMQSFDWSQTSLGPVSAWPQSLKTCVRIMLTSRQPMFVWWGSELINLYNDAYKAIVGGKHPSALGQPAAYVWREIWDQVGPRAESALLKNEGTYDEALLLIMERNGYPEETYYTFSYSPVPNDQGGTGGIICANSDDTQRIISERQLALLRELAARTADARTFHAACTLSASCLATNPYDLPFAMIYLVDPDRQCVLLTGTCGIEPDHAAVPQKVDLNADSVWPFAEIIRTQKPALVSNLAASFVNLPTGAWQRPPHQAIAVPIAPSGQTGKAGILIAGLNPFRIFDDNYQRFIDLVSSQIGASIANAQAYEEERKRAEALAEIDRAKTVFFSNVSHEFRTPLTLMLGPLEDILADSSGLLPSDREQLEIVHRNSLRLLKLVNTLLDFSRIEAGRVQAVYEPTDLAIFTTDLAGVFRSAIERAGIRLVVECPPLPEPMYVDREMWEKIVLNLLSNAFKFTFAGEIAVSLRDCRDRVELEVRDTGTGIPAEEIPHLFERFHRVQGARGRTYEGSGIGLSLVQELVQLHHGTIEVTSIINQGSSFKVSIPTGTAHLPKFAASQTQITRSLASTAIGAAAYVEEALRWLPQEDTGTQRLEDAEKISPTFPASVYPRVLASDSARILLADDNADMREYVQRLLLAQGYEVEVVEDGLAALTAMRQHPPDLVLTDIMMPRLDGLGLLQELRSDPHTREMPIILLSARAGEESRIEGLEAGADDYLIKPFSARELLARVEANLKMAQMRQQAVRREQELRIQTEAARSQISNILESITDAFVAFDREWHYTYANEQATRLLEKSQEELLGKQVWQEVFPELVPSLGYEKLHYAVKEKVSVVFEEFVEPMDKWLEIHAYPSSDGVAVYFRDITARKRAEAALSASEERFRAIVNQAAVGIAQTDLTGRFLLVNQKYCDILGYSTSELLQTSLEEIIHPDDWPLQTELFQTLVTSGNDFTIEKRYIRKDASLVWVSSSVAAICDASGKPQSTIAIVLDITERKRNEAERARLLAREQQHTSRLQKLAEASLTINSVISLNERLQLITEQARDIIGAHQSVTSMTVDDDWAQGIHTISLSDKYAKWRNYNENPDGSGIYTLICRTQQPIRLTQAELEAHPSWNKFGKAGGKHPPMRGWLAVPLISRNGKNLGLIQLSDKYEGEFTAEDEAILVQLAQMAASAIDNVRLYEASQQANRIKDEFLAVLSHELRSPLNPILGWSKLLRTQKLDATQTAQALSTIERNAKLQADLIEDLLDVSRILRGKLSLNVCPVNLIATIQAAIETVRLAAEAKSIQIQTTLAANIGQVAGDANRLQQVIWNLLSNAVKFTPEGGRVEIRLEQISSVAQITVSDTGKGIEPNFLPYVFDYFRQADAATTRKFGGLGLGLAIVHHLVELHGGTVSAESPGIDRGATFTVKLPLMHNQSQIHQDPQQSEPAGDLKGIKILFVDDNTDTREFIAFLLEQHGATIAAVPSANEALIAFTQFQPDILLSDIGMPEMDGYMLMRQVRSMPPEQGGQIQAIALTAYAGEIDYQQALTAGFQRHISKPVDPVTLVEAITELIGKN
ncbi:MAG: ATP-binding protein [Aulosira sp. ZfuCHP01]|nr:ATP-binding protein [Aulosira sp. ZfuVER01]MDZ8002099.1 ATP-binding protein [Aulosira sp. DedVER01a]MDZ8052634.1 ATP-binding protein [Aulosira sp. ZfuCHP01]